MPLIVQKFGGTSVADPQKILAAARKAIRAQQEGNQVVMVVSAMGHNTDHLIDLARQITDKPPAREMDMLLSTGEQVSVALMAMAIHSLGHKAISLTGAQIGIKTDSTHTKARIQSISTERMQKLLDEGNIVIAAGFQGIDEDFNITTLGRGGSDTTAVALAAVLRGRRLRNLHRRRRRLHDRPADCCPRPAASSSISYDEMLELASLGAGVMHSRSIEFGKKFGVPIHVRSSFTDMPGTMIVAEPEAPDHAGQRRGARQGRSPHHDRRACPTGPARAWRSSRKIAARNISVDMIVQNVGADGQGRHLVHRAAGRAADDAGSGRKKRPTSSGPKASRTTTSVAKVSVVGLGMATADRRGREDVPRAGRRRHQHPDDHHQRDQNLGARAPRAVAGGSARRAPGVSNWKTSRKAPARQRAESRAATTATRRSTSSRRLQGHGRPDDRRHHARRDARPA